MGCGASAATHPEPPEANPPPFSPVLLLPASGAGQALGAALAEACSGSYTHVSQVVCDHIIRETNQGLALEGAMNGGSEATTAAATLLTALASTLHARPAPHLIEGFPSSVETLALFESECGPCRCALHISGHAEGDQGNRSLDGDAEPDMKPLATDPISQLLEERGVLYRVCASDALADGADRVREALSARGVRGGSRPAGPAVAEGSWAEGSPAEGSPAEGGPVREEIRLLLEEAAPLLAGERMRRLAAVVVCQRRLRGELARRRLASLQRAATNTQAIARGSSQRNRLRLAVRRAVPLVVSAGVLTSEAWEGTGGRRRAAPYEADLSSIRRVAKNDLGLFAQPAAPAFRIGLVQVSVRGQTHGGGDKSSNGHRFDTVPLANGMIEAGMSCHPFHYTATEHHRFLCACRQFDALLLRMRPGHIEQDGGSQERFDDAMAALERNHGVRVWPAPGSAALPAELLAAFADPEAAADQGDGLGGGGAGGAEEGFLGPCIAECLLARCSDEHPLASWIDVSEGDMLRALRCGYRIGMAMRALLSGGRSGGGE